MNSDKKIIITRDTEAEIVKLTQIDLYDDGRLSSFGTRVFKDSEDLNQDKLVAWAKKATAVEEANEVEIVALESFTNDPEYSTLVKQIEEATEVTNDINDDPSTSKNEAEEE